MKKQYIFGAIILLLGILFVLVPFHLGTHVCPPKADDSFMKCHWMGEVVRMLGALIAILGIFVMFLNKMSRGMALGTCLVAVCQICLQFFVIGTCKTQTMPCNVYTKPTVLLLSGILIIVCVVYLFLTREK